MKSRTAYITKIEVIEVDLDTLILDGGTLDNLECIHDYATYNVVFGRVMAGVHDSAFEVGADPNLWATEGDETIVSFEYTS